MQVRSIPTSSVLFVSQFFLVFLAGLLFWIAFGLLTFLLSYISPGTMKTYAKAVGHGGRIVVLMKVIIGGGMVSALVAVIGSGLLALTGRFINIGKILYHSDETPY